MNNCRTCGQKMRLPIGCDADHHLAKFPYGGRCLGCELMSIELEKFLIRATGRSVMGDWTDGFMREIIADPQKHLGLQPSPADQEAPK